MYIKLEGIIQEEASQFLLESHNLIYQKKSNQLVSLDLKSKEEKFFFDDLNGTCRSIQRLENCFLLVDSDSFPLLIDIHTRREISEEVRNGYGVYHNVSYDRNYLILWKSMRGFEKDVGLWDYEKGEFIWTKKLNPTSHLLTGKSYFIREFTLDNDKMIKCILRCLDIQTGEDKWRWDTRIFAEDAPLGPSAKNVGSIVSVLGIWKNQLIVWVNPMVIVAFNIDTGKVEWRIPFLFAGLYDYFGPGGGDIKLIAEEDKLIFASQFVYELNLNTREGVITGDFREMSYQDKWAIISFNVVDHLIYFIGRKGGGIPYNHVGVFDRLQEKVVWSTKLDLVPYGTLQDAPKVEGDYMAVRENKGRLFLFKKNDQID